MNDFRESSALNRMQERYWATKQAVFKKLGKKDDDCIIASDAELDSKLELFQTIEESFFSLMRILENYQDRLCGLAQEENALGRFLKENGKYDKTRAGKVMTGAGKALSFSAQQKLSLRLPLVRLYHEVETFQYRAIVDCLQTVEKMEKARTAYRGALMWMKDVSQQLDPDTCKQLEKFRKVQSNVRKTKARFDKLKLDTLQKVDLLSFSRCNLFSQALAAYQNTLITICEKVSQTMASVAETTKGYQYYEFSTLKELTETSKKLAEETTEKSEHLPFSTEDDNLIKTDDKDVLLYFESEYCDDEEGKKKKEYVPENNTEKEKLQSASSNSSCQKRKIKKKRPENDNEKDNSDDPLLDLDNEYFKSTFIEHSQVVNHGLQIDQKNDKTLPSTSDLLTGVHGSDADKSDLELLQEILDSSGDFSLANQWSGSQISSCNHPVEGNMIASLQSSSHTSYFLPSQLLDMNTSSVSSQIAAKGDSGTVSNAVSEASKSVENNPTDKNKKGKQDMSSWYNLFADLDPLANPDLIGKKHVDEINC